MTLADFPELARASDEEKLSLANELLTSVGLDPVPVDPASAAADHLPQSVKDTLDSRWAAYKKYPSRALTVEQFREAMREEFGFR